MTEPHWSGVEKVEKRAAETARFTSVLSLTHPYDEPPQ